MTKRGAKSRLGCTRCRKRRIKCDERKPSCSECTAKSHPCEYRPMRLQWRNGLDHTERRSQIRETATADDETVSQNDEQMMPLLSGNLPGDATALLVDFPSAWPFFGQEPLHSFFENTVTFVDTFLNHDIHSGDSNCSRSFAESQDAGETHVISESGNPSMNSPFNISEAIDLPVEFSNDDLIELDADFNEFSDKAAISLGSIISDPPTTFISYYFSTIAPMFCCSMQIENPFIIEIGQRWNCSGVQSLPYVLQSMAAAYLAESTPHLATVAYDFREEAKRHLFKEIENLPQGKEQKSLEFSIILLGASAGWTPTPDSMSELFRKFVVLYRKKTAKNRNPLFDKGIIQYWQMFFTYMSSNEPSLAYLASPDCHELLMKQIEFPTAPNTQSHPWTGTSSGLISSLITLGELIRHHESIGPKPPRSTCTISDHEAAAAAIESRILLHCTYVRSTDVTQPEDGLSQLSYLSELYLIAILLQLYRVFPDLVQKHRESIYRTPRGFELFQGANREQNLYKIAEHILLLAIGGNQDPSVLRFELVPVIIACSELRLQAFRSDEISISISKDASEQHAGIIKVAQMRQLAKNHLFFMRSVFPGKRINQLANVISAMWVSLDNSMRAEDSFSWIKWLMLNGQDVI